MPEHLIIECEGTLRAFWSVVCSAHMPTADIDAALSKIFYTLRYAATAPRQVYQLIYDFAYGEGLYEHAELEPADRLVILHASRRLFNHLMVQLQAIGAYEQGVLSYDYERLLNHDTLILRYLWTPGVGAAAGGGSGHT